MREVEQLAGGHKADFIQHSLESRSPRHQLSVQRAAMHRQELGGLISGSLAGYEYRTQSAVQSGNDIHPALFAGFLLQHSEQFEIGLGHWPREPMCWEEHGRLFGIESAPREKETVIGGHGSWLCS
jgi:hypothetical protein